jgi:hypothetical protein
MLGGHHAAASLAPLADSVAPPDVGYAADGAGTAAAERAALRPLQRAEAQEQAERAEAEASLDVERQRMAAAQEAAAAKEAAGEPAAACLATSPAAAASGGELGDIEEARESATVALAPPAAAAAAAAATSPPDAATANAAATHSATDGELAVAAEGGPGARVPIPAPSVEVYDPTAAAATSSSHDAPAATDGEPATAGASAENIRVTLEALRESKQTARSSPKWEAVTGAPGWHVRLTVRKETQKKNFCWRTPNGDQARSMPEAQRWLETGGVDVRKQSSKQPPDAARQRSKRARAPNQAAAASSAEVSAEVNWAQCDVS